MVEHPDHRRGFEAGNRKITRREFEKDVRMTLLGTFALEAGSVLAEDSGSRDTAADMNESEHKRRSLQEAVKAREEFRRDPQAWWRARRESLFLSPELLKKVIYAVGCIDEGDDLHISLPGELGRKLPDCFDVISVPGSGATYPKLAEDIQSLHVHVLGSTSHHECNACQGDDGKAETSARKLAEQLTVPYLGMVRKLHRPEHHIALGACGRYTPKTRLVRMAKAAPRDFDISQFAVKQRKARIGNWALALKIAFHKEKGYHALLLDEKVPFELCGYVDPMDRSLTKTLVLGEMDEAIKRADIDPALKGKVLELGLIEKRIIEVA